MFCRLQKEKEDALADIDCKREQYDKLQVGVILVLVVVTLRHADVDPPAQILFHLSSLYLWTFSQSKG